MSWLIPSPYRTWDYPRPSSRNQMLYRLVRILDRRGETVEENSRLPLIRTVEMFFTSSSDSARTRFFLNFYGLSSTASLNGPKGKYPTNITAREAFERKKVDYELDKMKDRKRQSPGHTGQHSPGHDQYYLYP